jgi:thiol-disulfide isomerase/thioredoxin
MPHTGPANQSEASKLMKIQIVFHSRKLRLAFLVSLCAMIGLFASISICAHADTPALPEEILKQADGKMVLLDFYSAFCGTCQMMEPYVRALEAKTSHDIRFKRIDLASADGEKYMDLYNIQGTPTYVLFDAQGKPLYRMQELITPLVLEKQVLRLTGQLKQVSIPEEIVFPPTETGPVKTGKADPVNNKLNDMILVSFENAKCQDCQSMTPYLQGFEMTGQQGLHVVHLDTETKGTKQLMDELSIKSLPAYVLFDNSSAANNASRGELFRMTGIIKPRVLWDLIRLFGNAGV